MSNRFQTALDIQDAVNLRALAREFVRVVDAASEETQSTERTWRDAAVVAFISKFDSLAGMHVDGRISEAFMECAKRAKEATT